MFTMALGFPNSILADDDLRPHGFIRAEVHEHQLLVRTEPNAIVVITREPSDGVSFQANEHGILKILLSDVPAGRVTISELTPVPDRGSQAQQGSSFYFVPNSGFSVGNHFYIATSISFANSDQIDSDLSRTYGTGARLARWEDLVADSIQGPTGSFAPLSCKRSGSLWKDRSIVGIPISMFLSAAKSSMEHVGAIS